MPISTGVFKKLAIKKQAGVKQKAAAGPAGSSRYLRRVTSTIDLNKANYTSQEIIESQQKRDMRHGVKSVAGSISGELSIGSYQQPLESVCRKNAVKLAADWVGNTLIAVSTSPNTGKFTKTGGSFLGDGFKLGDVIRASGFTGAAVANNNKNFMIIGIDHLEMTVVSLDGSAIIAKPAGDNVTLAFVGKKTFMPESNHTRDYYTIEHFYGDVGLSEQFLDCVFTGFTVNLPPTGMATVEFPIMGLDMETGEAQYFNAPAAASTGAILAAVNGILVVDNEPAALVTGLSIVVNGNYTAPGGVVGSNVDPDIFPGTLDVSGQITVLFNNAAYRDKFLNETESSIYAAFTGGNGPNAGFVAFTLPRVKFSGSSKNDGNVGLTLTMPYTALEYVGGLQSRLPTTLSIQDSAFV